MQLLNNSNVLVPVRLRVHQMEENNRTVHVIRVRACVYVIRVPACVQVIRVRSCVRVYVA